MGLHMKVIDNPKFKEAFGTSFTKGVNATVHLPVDHIQIQPTKTVGMRVRQVLKKVTGNANCISH